MVFEVWASFMSIKISKRIAIKCCPFDNKIRNIAAIQ